MLLIVLYPAFLLEIDYAGIDTSHSSLLNPLNSWHANPHPLPLPCHPRLSPTPTPTPTTYSLIPHPLLPHPPPPSYWALKKEMASGSEPPHIRTLLARLRPLTVGLSLCGAGAGGFAVVVLRRDKGRADLEAALKAPVSRLTPVPGPDSGPFVRLSGPGPDSGPTGATGPEPINVGGPDSGPIGACEALSIHSVTIDPAGITTHAFPPNSNNSPQLTGVEGGGGDNTVPIENFLFRE